MLIGKISIFLSLKIGHLFFPSLFCLASRESHIKMAFSAPSIFLVMYSITKNIFKTLLAYIQTLTDFYRTVIDISAAS